MSRIDIYHRAFKDFRKVTINSQNCIKDRNRLAESNKEADKLNSTKYLCTIEDDWIVAIEEGLVYVEKALAEERQFIRTNGEVVPIEKAKKISKDSVSHLAKHSDMITHVSEETKTSLVPDELYMVEKLSDYAVYENRFLYMMLCYIRNFIEYRLEKIEDLRRTYKGETYINKEVTTAKRHITIETKIYDERHDNPFPIADETSAALVRRIEDCRQIIDAFLKTDLMTQVAKTPMIKPPIVKTNVLKMNNNFKRALALYDYIASYKGLGYTYEEVNYNFAPYSEKVADEIAEAANLMVFLSYKVGNDIEGVLERNYNEEERRRKDAEQKKLVQRIQKLKKRALESNKSLEEYMLVLEDRIRQLEKDSEELANLRVEVETLTRRIDEINAEKAELRRQMGVLRSEIEKKEREIAELNQKYIEDMAAAKALFESNMNKLAAENEAQAAMLKAKFAEEMAQKIEEHQGEVAELNAAINELHGRYDGSIAEYNAKTEEVNRKLVEIQTIEQRYSDQYTAREQELEARLEEKLKAETAKCSKEVKAAKDETALIRGELDGMRAERGLMTPSTDYATRERFLELEAAYMAFHKFFKSQWEITKKEIRKTILWNKDNKKNRK
ncbi:MAG: hypothetical protein J1G05_06700 [Clostridiales bacterium]|nr:hypothetical protein [Clostridiales bacterium]